MKKLTFAIVLMMFIGVAHAQGAKINWTYSAKKLAGNKYELHLIANPPAGWHIYSQTTPAGGPVQTTFKFNNNALVTRTGKVKETGKIVNYFDVNFKVNVKYFEGKVDFVQIVIIKGKIKTNVSGEIESMICNDKICMPPSTEKFNIALN